MKFLFLLSILSLSVFANERLINGAPADLGDWPASVYASMGSSRCTATVVGEKTLLIAAHCVSNGGTASFKAGGNSYSGKCTHAPDYDRAAWETHNTAIIHGQVPAIEVRNSTADWALCLISQPVTGVPFEVVNQDASRHVVGDNLTLTGYGCVRPGGGGGNDGVYRIGQAKITALPSGNSNDIVTKGGAALCFGDSGGPAFYVSGQNRWVVSVNSRGDIKTTSYLSSVSTGPAKAFFSSWASSKGVTICGIHATATGCRNSIIVPPTPTIFNIFGKTHMLKVTLKAGEKLTPEVTKKVLKPSMEKLDKKGNP